MHSSLVGSGQGRSGWYFKAAFLYAFFTSACVASFFNSSTVYGFLCFAPPCTAPLDRNATSSIQSNHINGYVLGRFSSAVPLAPKLQAPISTQSHLERIAVLRSHNVVLLLTSLPKTDKKRKKSAKHRPASNGDRSSRKVRISQQLEQDYGAGVLRSRPCIIELATRFWWQ